jgi:hypothetical protein
MSKTYPNPVLEIYRGVNVRRWNDVKFKVTAEAFKELLDLSESTGLSVKKIIAYSGQPCDRCKGMDVVVFTDAGTYRIKRGILKVPHQTSGHNIIQTNHAKGCTINPAPNEII